MGFFKRKPAAAVHEKGSPHGTSPAETPGTSVHAPEDAPVVGNGRIEDAPTTFLACLLGGVASMGGFIFGYESGQIGGMCNRPLCCRLS